MKLSSIIIPAFLLAGCSVSTLHEQSPQYITNTRLQLLHSALVAYKNEYGAYPQGNTSDVISSLRGVSPSPQNERQIRFLPVETETTEINTTGKYLDGWQQAILLEWSDDRSSITIRSIGEDGIKNTDDDIVRTLSP